MDCRNRITYAREYIESGVVTIEDSKTITCDTWIEALEHFFDFLSGSGFVISPDVIEGIWEVIDSR